MKDETSYHDGVLGYGELNRLEHSSRGSGELQCSFSGKESPEECDMLGGFARSRRIKSLNPTAAT